MKFSKRVVAALQTLLVAAVVTATAAAEQDQLAQRDQEDFTFWRGLQEDVASLPTGEFVCVVAAHV